MLRVQYPEEALLIDVMEDLVESVGQLLQSVLQSSEPDSRRDTTVRGRQYSNAVETRSEVPLSCEVRPAIALV